MPDTTLPADSLTTIKAGAYSKRPLPPPVRITASKSKGHTSPGRPIRNNNGAQATET
jgi:hypothetical protein